MAFDEENLKVLKKQLRTKLQEIHAKQRNLEKIMACIASVETRIVNAPTPEDPAATKVILPKDSDLGANLTDARKGKIYDKIVTDVAAL